jgi:transposase
MVARRSHRDRAKLIRVLKATLKGPQRSSQRPTKTRPHRPRTYDVSGQPGPIFNPERASPQGDQGLRRRFAPFGMGLAGSRAMTTLVDNLVPDELWALVEPLLPAPPRPPHGGRRRTIPDRACFAAIVYMARTSTPWRLLPARELGCGSPATCWRRLTEWARAGMFDQLHLAVLDRLGERGELDWARASVDTMSVRAKRGGPCGRKSSRSWQAWDQAPPRLRRQRAAADWCGDRRQRERHHHVPGGRG